MKKNVKRFWRFFGPGLVLLELAVYLTIRHSPLVREIAALLFFAVNSIIVARLAYVKALVNKHNAKVDADMAVKQAILNKTKIAVQTPPAAVAKKRTVAQPETSTRVQEYIPAPALA